VNLWLDRGFAFCAAFSSGAGFTPAEKLTRDIDGPQKVKS